MSGLIVQQSALHEHAWYVANDPIIPDGCVATESDTGKIKIGDGSKKWSQLQFSGTISLPGVYFKHTFETAAAPDLILEIRADEVWEFDFMIWCVTENASLSNTGNNGTYNGILATVGSPKQFLANSWIVNQHYFGSSSHAANNAANQTHMPLAQYGKASNGSGKIYRRKQSPTLRVMPFSIDCSLHAYYTAVSGVQVQQFVGYLNNNVQNIPDTETLKLVLQFHTEARGWFKYRKVS